MQTLELDIEKYDVVEMEATEKEEVDGGTPPFLYTFTKYSWIFGDYGGGGVPKNLKA